MNRNPTAATDDDEYGDRNTPPSDLAVRRPHRYPQSRPAPPPPPRRFVTMQRRQSTQGFSHSVASPPYVYSFVSAAVAVVVVADRVERK